MLRDTEQRAQDIMERAEATARELAERVQLQAHEAGQRARAEAAQPAEQAQADARRVVEEAKAHASAWSPSTPSSALPRSRAALLLRGAEGRAARSPPPPRAMPGMPTATSRR